MISSSDTTDDVVLVDDRDRPLGTARKLDAHRDGRLHRAVSVMLFDGAGRVLLQRRANEKYHSGGLWSNTCCGHPRPGESVLDAARRRLRAEMGIVDCELALVASFIYRAQLGGGLVEHELDHVVVGEWRGQPTPDACEVSAWTWVSREQLASDLHENPGRYTAWLEKVMTHAGPSLESG